MTVYNHNIRKDTILFWTEREVALKDSDGGKLKLFRETYKDLEGTYDIFPKLCGLSGTEYWALSMIDEGITTQYGICEHLTLSRQTVNSAFRQLRKKGLIRLEAMDDNLRVKQVYLTEEGKAFVEKELSRMHGLEREVWQMLEEEEKDEIIRLLCKYKTLLAEKLKDYQKNLM